MMSASLFMGHISGTILMEIEQSNMIGILLIHMRSYMDLLIHLKVQLDLEVDLELVEDQVAIRDLCLVVEIHLLVVSTEFRGTILEDICLSLESFWLMTLLLMKTL